MIDSYSFGRIKIDGELYQQDVIVFPHKVHSGWRRRQGHRLAVEDLKPVLSFQPDLLVVGTGAQRLMDVPQSVITKLEQQNIQVETAATPQAIEKFNQYLQQQKRAAAALHLTC